jgi:hypothetical protein
LQLAVTGFVLAVHAMPSIGDASYQQVPQDSERLAAGVASALNISLDSARSFISIANRFGEPDIVQYLLTAMLAQAGSAESTEALERSLLEIERALANSNAENDLSAPPTPTGDGLFDRLALVIDERVNALDSFDIMGVFTAAAVPDEVLAQWADDFGNDPRYWELRYICKKRSVTEPTIAELEASLELLMERAEHEAAATQFLEEAYARGIASSNTLLLLYEEKRALFRKAARNVDENEGSPYSPESASELLTILNEAVELGPDQAWPYYMRALYWYENDQPGRGLVDIQAGNLAPYSQYPAPFPVHMVTAGLGADKPTGSAVVSGAVFLADFLGIPATISAKKALKSSLTEASLTQNPEVLEAWHQFGCRFANGMDADFLFSLIAIVLTKMVRTAAIEDPSLKIDDPRRETLGRMLGGNHSATDALHPRNREFDVLSNTLTLSLAGLSRGLCVATYLDREITCRAIASGVIPALQDLGEVHYPQLEMTPNLRQYQEVTSEELLRREKERRADEQSQEGYKSSGDG